MYTFRQSLNDIKQSVIKLMCIARNDENSNKQRALSPEEIERVKNHSAVIMALSAFPAKGLRLAFPDVKKRAEVRRKRDRVIEEGYELQILLQGDWVNDGPQQVLKTSAPYIYSFQIMLLSQRLCFASKELIKLMEGERWTQSAS